MDYRVFCNLYTHFHTHALCDEIRGTHNSNAIYKRTVLYYNFCYDCVFKCCLKNNFLNKAKFSSSVYKFYSISFKKCVLNSLSHIAFLMQSQILKGIYKICIFKPIAKLSLSQNYSTVYIWLLVCIIEVVCVVCSHIYWRHRS